MTKEDFKEFCRLQISSPQSKKNCVEHVERIREHDPVLAKLMENIYTSVQTANAYIKSRLEK